MFNLADFDRADYPELLGAEVGECTVPRQAEFAAPDTRRRVILIGVGGSGVKTLDRLKKRVTEQLDPRWSRYAAFLAVDTDLAELRDAQALARDEQVYATMSGAMPPLVMGGRNFWPAAWQYVAEEEAVRQNAMWLNGDGTGGNRLVGKLKLYSKNPVSPGVDEQILEALRRIRDEVLEPVAPGGEGYEIYVLGGLSGGTGSGMIPELPALIREAFPAEGARVHALAYLPDTAAEWNPRNRQKLEANGYAALKELEYYCRAAEQPGQMAEFPYNGAPRGKHSMELCGNYYHNIWLLGTRDGRRGEAWDAAMDTAEEYLMGVVTGEIREPEEPGFKAMGIGRAVSVDCGLAPETWAWSVREVLRSAGACPVSEEHRRELAANGARQLPFLGEYQLETAQVLNQQRMELLKSLTRYMSTYQAQTFKYEAVNGEMPDYREVMDGTAEANIIPDRKHIYITATSIQARNAMEERVKEQFRLFRSAVKEYVKRHGPMAFWNLYSGCACQAEGQQPAKSIGEYLQLLVDNYDPASGNPMIWPSAKAYAQQAQDVRHQLNSLGVGLMGLVNESFTGRRRELAGRWVQKFDLMVNAEINEKRREYMLGRNGILDTWFVQPAQRLAQEIYAFGKILESISDGYAKTGGALDSYEDLVNLNHRSRVCRLHALEPEGYERLMTRLRENVACVDAVRFRDGLVEDFFQDPGAWLHVDPDQVELYPDGRVWRSGGVADARRRFDQFVLDNTGLDRLGMMTMEEQLESFAGAGDAARRLAQEIRDRSALLFDGYLGEHEAQMRLVIPQALNGNHPDLVDAMAWVVSRGMNMHPERIQSMDSFSVRLIRWRAVRPGWLMGLAQMKWNYESHLGRIGSGLHGLSPDQISGGQKPWAEYPGLTAE